MYLSLSELHLEFAVCLFRIKFLYILFTFIFRQFNTSSHQLPHSHNSLLVFFVEQFHLLVEVGFEKAWRTVKKFLRVAPVSSSLSS